jgi:hypothetical protein
MPYYCVNKNAQSNGDHEVHNLSGNCPRLPNPVNQVALGQHATCVTAVSAAKRIYPRSNGCAYCASACNTG